VDVVLTGAEVRVIGSLVEKETTTPDYYPLSLNALINACNQKSNRDPVMELTENEVRDALDSLNAKGLAGERSAVESRVTKYEHRLQEVFNVGRRETAVLCVLLLRGPQTPGELRGRTERMYRFSELDEVQSALQHLIQREPPLVKMLPRQPGTKESRYVHLLAGDAEPWETSATLPSALASSTTEVERIARLESELASLQAEVDELKQQLADFRKQFD